MSDMSPEIASANSRRMIVLAIFVVFCFVVLAFLYQLQVRYTEAQCYSRQAIIQKYNETWQNLAVVENKNTVVPPAIREERIRIYEQAQVPNVGC